MKISMQDEAVIDQVLRPTKHWCVKYKGLQLKLYNGRTEWTSRKHAMESFKRCSYRFYYAIEDTIISDSFKNSISYKDKNGYLRVDSDNLLKILMESGLITIEEIQLG